MELVGSSAFEMDYGMRVQVKNDKRLPLLSCCGSSDNCNIFVIAPGSQIELLLSSQFGSEVIP